MTLKTFLLYDLLILSFLLLMSGASIVRRYLDIKETQVEYENQIQDRKMDLQESRHLLDVCGEKEGHYSNGSVTCGKKEEGVKVL